MKIKIITYKRINNLGNYNSEHLEMTAELDENEDVNRSAHQLKSKVERLLGLAKTASEQPKEYDEKPF